MSKDKDSSVPVETPAAFSPGLVRQLVIQHIQEQQQDADTTETTMTSLPTITPEAAEAIGELLKTFVQEASHRAGFCAEIEQEATLQAGENTIQVRSDHCTKISAEMLMDFS